MSTINNNHLLSIPESEINFINDLVDHADIVDNFCEASEGFRLYRLVQDLFLNYLKSGELDGVAGPYRKQFCSDYLMITDTIFELERYADDYSKARCIRQYLSIVNKASEQEMKQANANIDLLIKRYGTLQNGLNNLNDYNKRHRSKAEKSEEPGE